MSSVYMVAKRKGATPKAVARKSKNVETIVEVEAVSETTPVKKRVLVEVEDETPMAKKHKVEEPKKEEVKEEADAVPAPSKEALSKINEQARVAISSLLKYVHDKGEKSLFPEADHGLSVMVTYKKPALVNGKALKKNIILPHPSVAASSAMFCVIMPDLDISDKARTDADVEKQAREWEERIQADHGLTRANIAKVMTQLQVERVYRTFADKRKLATAYDVFLVEKRVHKSVMKHLGKEFIKAHKMPMIFDYSKPLGDSLKKAAATTVFDLTANKMRIAVSAGHLSQPHADLVANVEHVVSEMLSSCPGGLPNVRSLFVQLASSQPSLPIYADDGSANDVTLKKAPTVRAEDKLIVDDCSTLPEGLNVAVSKSGRIRVIREKDGAGVLYPTVNDEWTSMDKLKPKMDPKKVEKKRQTKAHRKLKHKEAVAKALKKADGTAVYKKVIARPLMKTTTTDEAKPAKKAKKTKKASVKRAMKRLRGEMSLPWYYLERPARTALLRAFYLTCAAAYPIYVGLNFKEYIPDRAAWKCVVFPKVEHQ
uniref:Ribosomal protein n=1 Tax=Pristionchus pacificus TaxID=54126 RepID=A0A2A6BRP7_PRIPA